MPHTIHVKYCALCGSSFRLMDLIKREIKQLETHPEFQISYEEQKGALPSIMIDGRVLEVDYKNYKALYMEFKREIEDILRENKKVEMFN